MCVTFLIINLIKSVLFMMAQFLCCSCSKRVSVMIVAVISAIHYMLESIIIFMAGEDHRLIISSDKPYFYAMVSTQVFMVIVSLFLFVGAYKEVFWFCIPWIMMLCMHLLYYAYVILVLIMRMTIQFNWTRFEVTMLILLSALVLVYMLSIVITYVFRLIKNESKGGPDGNDEEKTSKIYKKKGGRGEEDSESDPLLFEP